MVSQISFLKIIHVRSSIYHKKKIFFSSAFSLFHSKQKPKIMSNTFFLFVFNWNHFEMRLLNLRINFYLFIYLFIFFIYCRQQQWKAVITGDTVTRLSILIRARSKNHLKKARGEIWPKRSARRNNTKTTKMRKKKTAINKLKKKKKKKKLILRLRSLIWKWFQLKTIKNSVRTRIWKTR